MSLTDACNKDSGILKELRQLAPGTMEHSDRVATIAANAADAIHANATRARAGALYHDIGKLESPQNFTENRPDDDSDAFKGMPPQHACQIITSHVIYGEEIAKERNLGHFIQAAIRTHHGDSIISYMAEKAKKDGEVIDEQFKYKGEPPRDKELTIISLADPCEAASRSLAKKSPENLRDMVNKIIRNRFDTGQLRASNMTLAELFMVKESIINSLTSSNHTRVSYDNQEKKNDTSASNLEKPSSETAEKA